MPNNIKAALSIVVFIVGSVMHWYEKENGEAHLSWLVVGLAGFMVVAMWIFPETNGSKNKKDRDQSC